MTYIQKKKICLHISSDMRIFIKWQLWIMAGVHGTQHWRIFILVEDTYSLGRALTNGGSCLSVFPSKGPFCSLACKLRSSESQKEVESCVIIYFSPGLHCFWNWPQCIVLAFKMVTMGKRLEDLTYSYWKLCCVLKMGLSSKRLLFLTL